MPMPTPDTSGQTMCKIVDDFSFMRVNDPGEVALSDRDHIAERLSYRSLKSR